MSRLAITVINISAWWILFLFFRKVVENVVFLHLWKHSKQVLILMTLMVFWVLIYISGSLFSLFWFHSRKEFQSSLIFAGIGYGLHSWQILIFTYAYALIFIHRRFGSLFWLLGVLIGSFFSQRNGSLLGPYLKPWGSLLVLETVLMGSFFLPTPPLNGKSRFFFSLL